MAGHIDAIRDAVIGGKHGDIKTIVQEALNAGVDPNAIINDALISAMDVVGKDFGSGKIFVPEMLVSAVTMKNGLDVVKPLLAGNESRSRGTVIMATVQGDLHDIGKNLVTMMLEGAGFKVIDLGVDLSVERLLDKVKEIKPDVLGLSALLTTTMPEMKKVVEELVSQGLRKHVKVMVGGAPVDRVFAEKIGADGFGANAAEAVELARRFSVK
ncbi:MAG: cobalamin-binding protein [Deltaproteobacteria bacterium HGW-Deltaproteobacteria-15]|jgi:corrinoid protein of di/trimethylamine methyltransferase|nr:MAG: cobalamin-binding protein [Deltaproteobacteria bacterium HGW-Deltaproteobacteria-15]